jgi:hypothetical protein
LFAAVPAGRRRLRQSWRTRGPSNQNLRVGVHSRLLDDFELDTVPVMVIDGRNLW